MSDVTTVVPGQVSTGTRAPLREYIAWWSQGTLISCWVR